MRASPFTWRDASARGVVVLFDAAERIDAKTALEWGLAYAVVRLRNWSSARRQLLTGSRQVRAQCSDKFGTLHASTFDNSLQEQLRAERSAQEMTLETQDCVEEFGAFSRSASLIFRNTRFFRNTSGSWLRFLRLAARRPCGNCDANRG